MTLSSRLASREILWLFSNRRFTVVFTRTGHWPLSPVTRIQFALWHYAYLVRNFNTIPLRLPYLSFCSSLLTVLSIFRTFSMCVL